MTYLIIRQKTYSDKSKYFSVHDQTEDKDMALDKVRGYTLANSEKDITYLSVSVQEPLLLKRENVITKDENFNYSQLELPFPEVQ